jgi:hypothetical protein
MPIIGIVASSISGNLTAYDSISTQVLTSSTSTVTFNTIPSGYKHLQLRATMMCDTINNMYLQLGKNSVIDSGSNYSWHQLFSNSSQMFSNGNPNGTFGYIGYNFNPAYPNPSIIDIGDYSNTNKSTTWKALAGTETGSSGFTQLWGGNWTDTAVVDCLRITTGGGSFTANSSFALYGIKG